MYNEYSPCSLLSPYIDKYWEFKGTPGTGMHIHILPDGCTDFIFTLGEVANAVGGSLVMQPYRAYFVGPMTSFSELVTASDTVHMFGIRFLPCGIFRFLNLPVSELTDKRVNLDELTSFFGRSFAERLYEGFSLQHRIEVIERHLTAALSGRQTGADPAIRFAVGQIDRSKGRLPIPQVAGEACLCLRHFQRKFKHFTGFTPKEYSRIIRFRNTVDLLRTSSPGNLLSVAVGAGYYDVPHLSREIRMMSGSTPRSFMALPPADGETLTYIEQ